MIKWVKENNRTARTVWQVQKMTSHLLKPGKDNTFVISRYYNIQNLRRYLVTYHNIDIILIYSPALFPNRTHASCDNSAFVQGAHAQPGELPRRPKCLQLKIGTDWCFSVQVELTLAKLFFKLHKRNLFSIVKFLAYYTMTSFFTFFDVLFYDLSTCYTLTYRRAIL